MGLSEKYFVGNMTAAYLTGQLNISSGRIGGNYEELSNKPRINGVELLGDRSFSELGFPDIPDMTGYARLSDIPPSLPASGGDADTVGGHTVKSDVPENAVFTDTVPDLSGYAQKADIPSSLPANGGNADTVDGKHASELVSALTLNNVVENYAAIPDNVNIAEWLIENAKIGSTYIRNDANVGQTNLPGGIDRWTYITYDGNRYLARVWTTTHSTTDFLLDYIYYPDGVNIKGWKEISATPLKSMTVSGTTSSYGDLPLFDVSSGKIPVFVAYNSTYCTPVITSWGVYYAHMISAYGDNMVNVAIDSATVYYIQT